jgi:hypothetical protein
MARAGIAEKRKQEREEAASACNIMTQGARVQVLEAKRKAAEADQPVAVAALDLAIAAIDKAWIG